MLNGSPTMRRFRGKALMEGTAEPGLSIGMYTRLPPDALVGMLMLELNGGLVKMFDSKLP